MHDAGVPQLFIAELQHIVGDDSVLVTLKYHELMVVPVTAEKI
jgi:hypothetical protein